MKCLQRITILAFLACFIVLLFNFNFEKDYISEVDNRYLTEFPEGGEVEGWKDFTEQFENYIADRIGFRDEMLLEYGILNDKIFHELVHPIYTYGKDGQIFSKSYTSAIPTKEHYLAFAHLIKSIQDYCEERDVPFIFVFTPTKSSVMPEFIPDGVCLNNSWVKEFTEELDRLGVNYVDNTIILKELHNRGEAVFNKKYDSNHWSDIGAFYGTNTILSKMHEYVPEIVPNDLKDWECKEALEESLLVSRFEINEIVPVIQPVNESIYEDKTFPMRDEIEHHPNYGYFVDYINTLKSAADYPKLMLIHGSHFFGNAKWYMLDAVHELIGVHNYENAVNFPYYYTIFKPDCVVFEFCEHTVYDTFTDEDMLGVSYNPTIKNACKDKPIFNSPASSEPQIMVEAKEALTKITWIDAPSTDYMWLYDTESGEEYDMISGENGYEVTLCNEKIWAGSHNFIIVVRGQRF